MSPALDRSLADRRRRLPGVSEGNVLIDYRRGNPTIGLVYSGAGLVYNGAGVGIIRQTAR